MHEHTIAQKIIEEAENYGEVKGITIEVGDLAHLPAEEMKAILEDLTDWEVDVIRKPALIKCTCDYEGSPQIIQHLHDNTIYECPMCKSSLPQILDGHDILLIDVEVYDDEDSDLLEEEDE